MKSKKVLMILTNGFDPDIRVYKEAKYLVENGIKVEILCWDRNCCYKDKTEEKIDGIEIKRFHIASSVGTGIKKQLKSYIKYILAVKKYVKCKEYDYLHCHDLDGMIIGYSIHKKRQKIIFDMHEFYEKKGHPIVSYIMRKLVSKFQNMAYKIIYVNEQQTISMKDKNKKKLVWIPNYPETEKFNNIQHVNSDILRVTYVGYVRHLEPLKNLIKAANELDNILVSIHGSGTYFNEIKQMEKEYKNVVVTGKFNHNDIAKFYENSDLIYIVYNQGNKNDETALPTKFYEAIITETPVIVSKNSLLEKVTNQNDIGFSVDGTDYLDIKNILLKIQTDKTILDKKIENLKMISKNYTWESVVKRLDDIYVEVYNKNMKKLIQ